MKIFGSFLFFLFHTCLLFAQDSIAYRIVLIGDGGELTNGHHPVAEAVKKIIPMDARTTIIYLGDNLYREGLPDDQYIGYTQAKAVLDSQLSIADGTPAKIYMIPGNHDWENGSRGGYDAILREQYYVDRLNKPNVKFYPEDGCPGPVEVSLGPDVTVVFFDSQWWIHPFDKPGIESDCDYKTKEEVLAQMEDIFSRNAKNLILLACHHTFKSISPHSGYYTFKQYMFPFTDMNPNLYIPLPIIGAIYPITRGVFGTPQDLKHPNYANMINDVQRVAKPYKNIIYAGGHEHSLQLIRDSSYYIVSGSGSKTTRVSKSKKTLFSASMTGFSVLEVSKNKNVRVSFYTVTDSIREAYSNVIMNFTTVEEPKSDSLNRQVENPALVKYKDTITISASDKYITHSPLKKFIMGTNYRKEWATPVNMKVFHIREEKGGLTIKSLGGGKQTKSLKLIDSKGKEWTLRTVDKDPTKAIPENFRATFFNDIVKDFISASHPYSALTIPELSKALDLTVAKPELFFVPEDPAFANYKSIFKNTICFLEESNPSPHGEETHSTTKVFNKLVEDNDHRADQLTTLRIRLLDILIADFDRHFDQYKWATGDTGKGKLYYPIPKDRDQAFFYSNGLLMRLISLNVLPFLKGFRRSIPDVKRLGEVAKDFDRVFLTDVDAKEWETTIKEVQQKLSDSVISRAVKKLPPEIYAIDSNEITKKLISRRDLLEKAGMTYYRFISRKVNIVGSNEKEYFKVTSNPEGLNVRVYGRKDNNDTSFLMYDRTFDHKVTKEIRLYGLSDDDLFDIDENASSRIKVRVIGGKGNDTFNIRGNVRNYLYDLKNVQGNYNYIKSRSHSKDMFSNEPPVNYYNILGFKYNVNSFPRVTIASNNDDGLLIGTGFARKTYGFRNEPFVSNQRFAALWAVNRGGRQYRYSGVFNHVIHNTDIVLLSELMTPGVNNFFGLGNRTKIDPTKPISYYRARYRHSETQLLFQKRLYETVKIMAGPVAYLYWNDLKDNNSKVLGHPGLIGLDSTSIYSNKSYIGGKLVLNINNLNNELFPTRGIQWNTELSSMAGISKSSNNITRFQSDMAVYASFNDPTRLIAVIQLGGGHIFNKNYEYFQALTLGSNNYLRGLRKNRYAGGSMMYGGLELRLKLIDVTSYLLPGSFGLVGFTETGRVWLKNEASHYWHYSYGGGIYYIPFNLFIVSGTIGYSKDEHIFNFSLGTKLNLNF
jgi:Omp85 superfamily domain/Calcineurin-like phosphoesterase